MAKLSENGLKFLIEQEEMKFIPQANKHGEYIVGLKHRGTDIRPDKIYTMDEIIQFFEKDKIKIENEVNKVFDDRFMSQNMFDALFSFAYDVGKLEKTELGKMIKKNPFDERIMDFWEYTYTCNFKNTVAVKRRKLEVQLYFKDNVDAIDI